MQQIHIVKIISFLYKKIRTYWGGVGGGDLIYLGTPYKQYNSIMVLC